MLQLYCNKEQNPRWMLVSWSRRRKWDASAVKRCLIYEEAMQSPVLHCNNKKNRPTNTELMPAIWVCFEAHGMAIGRRLVEDKLEAGLWWGWRWHMAWGEIKKKKKSPRRTGRWSLCLPPSAGETHCGRETRPMAASESGCGHTRMRHKQRSEKLN